MTGIQALERQAPDLAMRPAKIRRQEFEYIRHGTQTLIASFDVVSGEVIQATVGETRTEGDYLAHVQQTIATDPKATKWHLIMDCLNIHQSESLVRYVAAVEGFDIDLGVKGKYLDANNYTAGLYRLRDQTLLYFDLTRSLPCNYFCLPT
jgi:DDE superfamily endonuclease